jgi:N-carbamoylputrescine amidase
MPSPRDVQLGLIQMRCAEGRQENLNNATELIREAAQRGAQIVCLPEISLGPYFCQTEDHRHFALAEPVPGPATEHFAKLAKELNVVIVASLFERRAAGLYHNTAAVLDADGQYLGKYRKMHIPDDPLYYEKFYFTPGDLGFRVFATRYAAVGVLVCWDQWYPEAARLTAMRGAELLLYPTAIGWHPQEKKEFGLRQLSSWQLIQRSHAVANGCFVGSVNRLGHEGPASGGIEFWGHSFICDPSGQILAEGSSDQPQIVLATLELGQIDITRTHWPFLRDRRIDAYSDLSRRYVDEDRHDSE